MNGDVYQVDHNLGVSIYREHPGLMCPPKSRQTKSRVYSMLRGWLVLAGGFALVIMGLLAISR